MFSASSHERLRSVLLSCSAATVETDPLPSWNSAPAKRAIITFVHETTDQAHSKFVSLVEALEGAPKRGWIVGDMKNDWKTVFPEE